MTMNIGVLASHEGTTLQAVLDACAGGRIAARVSVVISNNADSGALRRARAAGVAAVHLSTRTHPQPSELDEAIRAALVTHDCELVLLAGYMKLLGARTLGAFAGRVLNTHPALLPKHGGRGLYGMHVHRAVLAAREHESGASVPLVDRDYDTGPVLAQIRVPVEPGDSPETLAARVQSEERELLVGVLADLASGKRLLPRQGI